MATTVQDLITDALSDLGVLESGEVPTFADSTLALGKLNQLVDSWITQSMMIYTQDKGDFTLTGAASYTVGVGGNCPIPRPVLFDLISVVWYDSTITPALELPLVPFTNDAWYCQPSKTLTSTTPTNYWWQPDFPLAHITIWPVVTSTTKFGRIYYPKQVVEFAALTDTVILPPGYRRAIVSNLAFECGDAFGVDPSQALVKRAQDSLGDVKRANRRLSELGFPYDSLIGGNRPWFDIHTGP
jgi:hypothetical protein